MNRTAKLGLLLIGSTMLHEAMAARYQCRSSTAGIRNVAVQGRTMTVVNPKTPNIVFRKESEVETRGNITRTENDAWILHVKEGVGSLKNQTFGDTYTCLQTGE
jgi:hypothetical protein